MHEKKERGAKYHISDRENRQPVVLVAADAKDAALLWARCSGRKESEAMVTPIGTRTAHAADISHPENSVSPHKETKAK